MPSINDKLADDIGNYLRDAKYPASKDDLLKNAASNNATPDVLAAIGAMSSSRFESVADVMQDYENG